MLIAACIVAAYFIGAIPIGYLVAKARGIDIFKVGSGNIGATNVARALGKKDGLIVFFLDVLKGFLPSIAAYYLCGHSQVDAFVVGMAAVGGHCLSPFLRFKGGKGVATGLGAVFGSCPLVAASAFGVFVVCILITRYVSFSSVMAAISLVPFGYLYKVQPALLYAFIPLALFVIYRHRANIRRLLARTEPKFELFKKKGNNEGEGASSPVNLAGVRK